jgi:hypothetical protein
MKPQRISGAAFLRRAVFRPGSEGAPDVFLGLAKALTRAVGQDVGLPELIAPGQEAGQLAAHLRGAPGDPGYLFANALGRLTEAGRRSGRILNFEDAKLILVVDQLEELFTVPGIGPDDRRLFVQVLAGLARSRAVWVIATVRADFWHRAADIPELIALAEGQGRIDLAAASPAELAEMIRKPAQAAGLSFEVHPETGIGFDAVLAQDAAAAPGALPLLSFTLDELYKNAKAHGATVLTYASYEALGGLEGAIANRADEIVGGLPPAAQMALPRVLRALTTVSGGTDQIPVARTAPLESFAEGSPARTLIDAFIAARLLVAASDGGTAATVRLAHEALISGWQRAREQIAEDIQDLRLRARLESAADLWSAANLRDRRSLFLHRGKPLSEAEDILRRRREDLSPTVINFIEASEAAYRNAIRWRIGVSLTAVAVFAAIAVFGSYQLRDWLDYRKQRQIEASRTDISGALLAFSTKRGATAADSVGNHEDSPFLEALIKSINSPMLDVNTLFTRVTEQVATSTDYRQLPELSTTLNGRVYLRDPPKNRRTFVLSVGVADYLYVAKLATPTNDARAFARAFDALGYQVRVLLDPGHEQLVSEINKFSNMIAAANTPESRAAAVAVPNHRGIDSRGFVPVEPVGAGKLAIVYLAGSGVRVDGVDYFLPADVDPTGLDQLDRQELKDRLKQVLIPIDDIVTKLERVSAIQVVIIDTCRDDPFARSTKANR